MLIWKGNVWLGGQQIVHSVFVEQKTENELKGNTLI